MTTALIQKLRSRAARARRQTRTSQLGANLKAIRARSGFTQTAVAEICDCTSQYISDIECGRIPSLRILALIAIALDSSVAELLENVDAEELLTAE